MSLQLAPGNYGVIILTPRGREVWRTEDIEHAGGGVEDVLWQAIDDA